MTSLSLLAGRTVSVGLLLQVTFLFCYERFFMSSLSSYPTDVIEAFNITPRYLDDLLNKTKSYFDQMLSQIYIPGQHFTPPFGPRLVHKE